MPLELGRALQPPETASLLPSERLRMLDLDNQGHISGYEAEHNLGITQAPKSSKVAY